MKYLPLLWAGLWRKPIRTVLTMLSIAFAFLLFGLLQGVISGFDGVVSKMSDTRLRVLNSTDPFEVLPIAYAERIARVPGVRAVSHLTLLSSIFQDAKNGIQAYATDIDSYLDAIADYKVPAEQRAAMRRTRMGAIVGADLAKRFNWHIGDRITLHSNAWVKTDGSSDWPLDIVGLANARPEDDRLFANDLIFNYEYLDSARATGAGTVHMFVVSLDGTARSSDVAIAIDRLFANSGNETLTVNEQEMIAALVRQTGDLQRFVSSIIGAVLFTLLFLAGSTMAQSIRDRLPEIGVLKALGFGDRMVWMLVFAEAAMLSIVAAAAGLAIAAAVFPSVFASLGVPPAPLSWHVYLAGFAIALLLAVLSATIPALRARRLTVVTALSGR